MKLYLTISLLILSLCSFTTNPEILPAYGTFTMQLCHTGHGAAVQSGDLFFSNKKVGHVIAINRSSERVKAKYFAYKDNGSSVHDRYSSFRQGKDIVLITSGAYANGFNSSNIPVGVTVDEGRTVNQTYDPKMDGLVIVAATGGIRISNIEAGDLNIKTTNGNYKTIDIKNAMHKTEFLRWCAEEEATVFQTHLLVYKDRLQFKQADSERSVRKVLVLAKQNSTGDIYHVIVYAKDQAFTLYEMAQNTLKMMNDSGLEVVAAANLDTGSIDVLSTSTDLGTCSNTAIEGSSNGSRTNMSNLLAYYVD